MNKFERILRGTNSTNIVRTNLILPLVKDQSDFDLLFSLLYDTDFRVVNRTADALEKVSVTDVVYFKKHKKKIFDLCFVARENQLKWNLAMIVSRLSLSEKELGKIWQLLTEQALNQKEGIVVRVNSLNGLFNLLEQCKELQTDFNHTVDVVLRENIPSLHARMRILQKTGKRKILL